MDNSVFENPVHKDLIEEFLSHIGENYLSDKELIKKAAIFADNAHKNQKRKSGEPYIIHPLAVATIVMNLNMDTQTVLSALMHDVIEDTEYTFDNIKDNFSLTVAEIVDGVTKIASIKTTSSSSAESETIRKMFFAMSKDPRVIIVKLSDKLHNMRTLQFLTPQRAKEIAMGCLEIFAPLADRLGMSELKNSLENEALRILHPDVYAQIKEHMESHFQARISFLNDIENRIKTILDNNDVQNYTIKTRIKHIYSIYSKMKKRNKDINEIMDVLGCRIICSSVVMCYTILGLIHQMWAPVDGRFKDYIAMPKANNYQSLHTTVLVDGKNPLEIQICTYEMEAVAQFGVASHWSYKAKSGSSSDAESVKKYLDEGYMRLMKRLSSWSEEIKENDEFMEEIKGDLLQDTIVVFTPKGKAIELPSGATALDFAYYIHSEVGNKTQSAKADGKIIPLSFPLSNTSVVEIITSEKSHPRLTWLKYAHTQGAKRKIKSWLNKHDENIIVQNDLIIKDKEKKKHDIQASQHKEEIISEDTEIVKHKFSDTKNASLVLGGEKNLMVSFAHCCSPIKGDDVVGYVSRGRGIIIHKKNCSNLKNMSEIALRMVEVEWDNNIPTVIKNVRIISKRRSNIFTEIEKAIKYVNGHLVEGHIDDDDGVTIVGTFTFEAKNDDTMKKLLKALKNVPAITNIDVL